MRAERVGFEPTVQLVATQLISSQLPSTTRAPFRVLMQFAEILMESFRLFIGVLLEPSFAEKQAAKRVGFQNEGSAPGKDGGEPPEDSTDERAVSPSSGRGATLAYAARGGSVDQAPGMGARTPEPTLDAALAEKVRAITSRDTSLAPASRGAGGGDAK